jgi:pSer/pThr/pTyr-binding forkhead associated (FHA) protein
MPPPNKPPPPRPPQTEDTDPGAQVDLLKTGSMRRLPRTPSAFPKPASKPAPPIEDDDEPTVNEQGNPGERTLIYDQNKGRALGQGGVPRLIVTAGPRAGTEFELTQNETSLGRGGDNTIVIPDLSVSRHHATIRREAGGFVVLDMGSGNGTRINGRPAGRHELQTGDIIDLGDTSLQFVEAGGILVKGGKRSSPSHSAPSQPAIRAGGAQPRPSLGDDKPELTNPRASGLQKRTPIYLTVAVVIVAILAVGLMRKRQREQAAADAHEHASGSQAVGQQRFAEAVELIKQGKWVDARDKLVIAASLDESDEEIRRYLERAKVEAPRAQAVSNARAALGRHDFKAAREQLAAVPDDSALADQAGELLQTLRAELDRALREAKAAADKGDVATAEALIAPVLEAEPTRRDAIAVRDAIGPRRRAVVRREPSEEKPAARVAKAQPAEESAPEEPAPSGGVAPIVDLYLTGDVRSAITRAESAGVTDSGAARLARQLRELDSAYRDGLAKADARKPSEALRALQAADQLDKAISKGRDSRLGTEIRRAEGKIHYSLGAAALGSDEGLPRAATHLRAAVQADPSHELAKQQLEQVLSRAKELYLRGYVAKDSDAEAARTAFRLVVDILPSGDPTGDKARRWLEKLDGKAPKDD